MLASQSHLRYQTHKTHHAQPHSHKTMNILILKRLVLVALSVVAVGSCSHADKLPNIVLVSIDTLRWDYLNTYGFAETESLQPRPAWLPMAWYLRMPLLRPAPQFPHKVRC